LAARRGDGGRVELALCTRWRGVRQAQPVAGAQRLAADRADTAARLDRATAQNLRHIETAAHAKSAAHAAYCLADIELLAPLLRIGSPGLRRLAIDIQLEVASHSNARVRRINHIGIAA